MLAVPGRGQGRAGRAACLAGTAPGRRRSQAGRRQARDDRRPGRAGQDVLAAAITACPVPRRRLAGSDGLAVLPAALWPALEAAWRDLAAGYPSAGQDRAAPGGAQPGLCRR